MKIRKTVKALIPTRQYGNVELETSLEFDDTVDSKESLLRTTKIGTALDGLVRQEFAKFHDEMERELDRVTNFGEKADAKEKSRKEKIKAHRKTERA